MAGRGASADRGRRASSAGVLGGTVHDLRRLSGGASRITSSFDLRPGRTARQPLILQQDRGDGVARAGRAACEAALLRAAAPGRRPRAPRGGGGRCRRARRRPRAELAGGRAPRGRDHPPQDPARPRVGGRPPGAHRAVRAAPWPAIHAIDPDADRGARPGDPLARSAPLPRCVGRGPPRARARARAGWRPTARAPGRRVTVHGDFRMRQPPGRTRRPTGGPRLGAGPCRRPGRGHRLALRPGLALRWPRRGGGIR